MLLQLEYRWHSKNNIYKINEKRKNKLLKKEEERPEDSGQTIQRIRNKTVKEIHGFIADPNKDILENINTRLSQMNKYTYSS